MKDLLKHSEKVADKFWNNKEDEIWDRIKISEIEFKKHLTKLKKNFSN